MALDLRVGRQLDADAQPAEPVARGHRARGRSARRRAARRAPDRVPRSVVQLVAEPLQVGRFEDRSAGRDDRPGLRALRGDVQPVAVPAILGVRELTAVDGELEVSQLDGGRLTGCAGGLRHGA